MKKKSIMACLSHIAIETAEVVCTIIYRILLWVSRKVLKRYFGIETPIYKFWHRNHAAAIQRKLDREHEAKLATI
jgi:glutamate synthase domain-containing protein 2